MFLVLVLNEVISVLISKQLITELMKPQAAYNHEAVREIIEDISQSSIMRLDAVSMSKLWDLITMVLKWQLTLADEIIPITLRHLYEIENYVTNPDTQLQLHKIQNLIDNFNKILSRREKEELKDDILFWLKDCNVRVSLLLRMGLQGMDGNFINNNLDPVAEEMLKNLGENIYAVTQNGKILEKSCHNAAPSKPQREVNELQLFVDEILGDRRLSSGSNDSGRALRLTIDEKNEECGELGIVNFNSIDVSTEDHQILDMLDDMKLNEKNEGDLKDDLLAMIGGEEI